MDISIANLGEGISKNLQSHSAENDAQNPVGNNGGQQKNLSVSNNTDNGRQQNNMLVLNNRNIGGLQANTLLMLHYNIGNPQNNRGQQYISPHFRIYRNIGGLEDIILLNNQYQPQITIGYRKVFKWK